MFRVVVFVVAIHATFSMPLAATFGCNSSMGTGVCPEAVICGLSELSTLDEKVDRIYQRLLEQRVGASSERLKSEQQTWLASRNSCGCDPAFIEESYRRRVAELERSDASHLGGIPLEAIGAWALSKRKCDLYKVGRLETEFSNERASDIVSITDSKMQEAHGGAVSCAISTTEISTSKTSISFPIHCDVKGQEIGQFVIINMRGNNNMRMTFLAARPIFKTADYVRCAP
jgi:uncharacterized protein